MSENKRKIRVDFRKNRTKPPRDRGWTRDYQQLGEDGKDSFSNERIRAKGDLSRKRTIITENTDPKGPTPADANPMPAIDLTECIQGRVIKVHGLQSIVQTKEGQFACGVRRVLRSLTIDERSVVATGDIVWIRKATGNEGTIENVEPRYGVLTRGSRGKEHVLVSNVDQLVIVNALAEPFLKPHLLDRYLVAASIGKLKPIICLNKADLVDTAPFQIYLGLYAQLGIPILLTSTKTGQGIDELRQLLQNRQTVFSGQSGVGKSSLLNAVEADLGLKVADVSEQTQKGRHTTTTAELIELSQGGWVVDTPGIRQFALWQIIVEELDGHFPEFHPFVPHCGFTNCTHLQETNCQVRHAALEGYIDPQRYTSYVGIYSGKIQGD